MHRLGLRAASMIAFIAIGSGTALAGPIQVGAGSFSSIPTINFDAFPGGISVGVPLPAFPGITISILSGSAGLQNGGSGDGWGIGSAPLRHNVVFNNIEITFATTQERVGFVYGGNTTNTAMVTTRNSGANTGLFAITSSPGAPDGISNWIFYGFEDNAGIDSIVLKTSGTFDGFFDLTFEPAGAAPIPEPTTCALVGVGAAVLAWRRRRKTTA